MKPGKFTKIFLLIPYLIIYWFVEDEKNQKLDTNNVFAETLTIMNSDLENIKIYLAFLITESGNWRKVSINFNKKGKILNMCLFLTDNTGCEI